MHDNKPMFPIRFDSFSIMSDLSLIFRAIRLLVIAYLTEIDGVGKFEKQIT